jgi:hypothetical protein
LFARFFREFHARLELEYRTPDIEQLVEGSTTVMPLDEFSRNQVICAAPS